MPKTVRANITQVSKASPKKKLQLTTNDKENNCQTMGRHKNEVPVTKDETNKAFGTKNLEKENAALPRRSKRRNALLDVVTNTPELKEQVSKCTEPKAKKHNKKKGTGVGKNSKKAVPSLTQTKINFPTSPKFNDQSLTETAPVETPDSGLVEKSDPGLVEKSDSGLVEKSDSGLDETFSVSHSLYIGDDEPTIISEVTTIVRNENTNMLTMGLVSESYWKELAESRRIALEKALEENESLHDQLEVLQTENSQLKTIVQQAEELASVVKGILQ